ncbi:imidazole glycerol phosphate synthase subunit HisF [Buchnera aphidicola (Mindarus keteleerifoliae)]|uniref:imidazole glycerol phosphate synthase subunit HisF n=1 Tax=Buchnera aphidicola TaxID=9 RepID=UPI0031B73B00
MLSKRIIPCLDIKDNLVVKGVQFLNHEVIGDILSLIKRYVDEGADELVFYDIEASVKNRSVDRSWITKIAKVINIPFCVAGGITNLNSAVEILSLGADKISINTPAIENANLINEIAEHCGVQCVVVGVDSWFDEIDQVYRVKKYTGDPNKSEITNLKTINWIREVQSRGAGEIVLNVMNQDGMMQGYDIKQLSKVREICKVPLIASGGAGKMEDFYKVFNYSNVDGALAASVFHKKVIKISDLKKFLFSRGIEIRKC